ncbi:MAG: phosphonatase-like hydrolase [Saprospiraceae bacterium]|nr:phosphonatase-like hydrolase [Saprospiraceae bacterium]
MNIELVVFDMAGTTVDEQNVVYKTVHQAIRHAGFDVSIEEVLLHAAGKEKFQAILDVLQSKSDDPIAPETAKSIFAEFETLLDTAYDALIPKAMPGAVHVFETLKVRGIKVVLNTGYKRPVAEGLLQKLGWEAGKTYDLLLTADDVRRSRPFPDMILAALQHFRIADPKRSAKVGDSIVDIEEGINAGCSITAGITTGAQTAEQLQSANPTHVIHSLEDLLQLL